MKHNIVEISERIRKRRESFILPNQKRKGISQEKIAEELGVERNRYARWESNGKMPLEILCKLCDVLGCSLSHITGEHEASYQDTDYVMKVTGLNEGAIEKLKAFKNSNSYESKQKLDIINALFVSSSFNELYNKFFQLAEWAKLCAYYEIEYPDIDFHASEFPNIFYVSNDYDDWEETQEKNENERIQREVHGRYKEIKEQHDLPRYYAEKSFSRFIDEYINAIPNTFDLEAYEARLDELKEEHKRIEEMSDCYKKMSVGLTESMENYKKLRQSNWYRTLAKGAGSEDLVDMHKYLVEHYLPSLEEKKKQLEEREASKNGEENN